jgi:hypothetical protein
MKKYVWAEDEETGDVQYKPGYLGMIWDGEWNPPSQLQAIANFPWATYEELCASVPGTRSLTVTFKSGVITVTYECEDDIIFLLDQVPSLEIFQDDGPEKPSMAAGSGYIIFQSINATDEDLKSDLQALLSVLYADLANLGSAELLSVLSKLGGSANVNKMEDVLGWPEDFYQQIKSTLLRDGKLLIMHGRDDMILIIRNKMAVNRPQTEER